MRWQRILRPLVDTAVREVARAARRATPTRGSGGAAPGSGADYPGDYTGPLDLVYAPHPDGRPDPGEIVWTWVPYEEDHRQGKDRPVLVIGRDDPGSSPSS